MYQAPAVYPPTHEDIENISEALNLGIAKADIQEYHDIVSRNLTVYNRLDKYAEPSLPVKYPRTPGYRPSGEENEYHAWYYKSDITGAPDGLLKGCKVVMKDSIPVAGVPMMHGSRVVEGYVPDYDPTVVTRVLDAGGRVVGKAVCEDFCFSINSFTSHPHPVLNPIDKTRSSGGSSSGCAALVQSGEVDMAIGADQGGSIRIPASWTGTVGLKPSYGLVPYTGIPSLEPSVDACGPMARNVMDCAKLLQAIAGDDGGLDMRQRRIPDPKDLPQYSKLLSGDVSGKRIGLVKEGFVGCEDDVAALVTNVARRLSERGAVVEEISIPMHSDGAAINAPVLGGAYQAMMSSQGYPIGPPSYYPTSAIDNYFAFGKSRSHDHSPVVKVVQLHGKYILDNYGLRFYAKRQNLCRLLREKYDEALGKYDALVMPTVKHKAPMLPIKQMTVREYFAESQSGLPFQNTAPFNASGHPAISINVGFSSELPVGMQITGRHLEDHVVLNIAYAYEQLVNQT